MMNPDANEQYQVEMLEEVKRIRERMDGALKHLRSIRENVLFFFWLTMISLFGWVFVLLIFGSIGAMM